MASNRWKHNQPPGGGTAISTSFIYHAFRLHGYDYVRQDFAAGCIHLHARPKKRLVRCTCCKSRNVIRRVRHERWPRTVPIGLKPVWLCVDVPRVQCRECGRTRRIDIGIAGRRRWHARAFERFAPTLPRMATMLDLSRLLGIGWDGVKDIFKRHLQRRFGASRLSGLRCLAIDEISVRKGQKNLTLVMDLHGGAVVFVGDGRGAEALDPFWARLKRSRVKLRAVATDMSAAYINAVRENLPGVPLVFDHFHVVKLMNESLTEIRRKLHHELSSRTGRSVLKGSRWILLKTPVSLCQERNGPDRLRGALQMNKPLAPAYYLKEDLRQI